MSRSLNKTQQENSAASLIDQAACQARGLGFDWAALVQLRGIDPGADAATEVCTADCAAYHASVPCRSDPIWGHARTTILPFLWEDLGQRPSCALKQLRQECASEELVGGGVPIHGPVGAIACLHVASHHGSESFRRHFDASIPQLQSIGQHAQQLLIELEVNARHQDSMSITPRQRQVLPWLIRGKTNWEIGKILGIAEDTVRQHVIAVTRALGASNRTEAAAMIASNGLTEIAPRHREAPPAKRRSRYNILRSLTS